MAYVLSTTAHSGKYESYDLDALPQLTWTDPKTGEQQVMPPRQLLAEGKVHLHEFFNLLRDRGIPDIAPTDGAQALMIKWARELKKRAEEAQILIGVAGAKQ